jgi:hypothetical protein
MKWIKSILKKICPYVVQEKIIQFVLWLGEWVALLRGFIIISLVLLSIINSLAGGLGVIGLIEISWNNLQDDSKR